MSDFMFIVFLVTNLVMFLLGLLVGSKIWRES